MGAAVATIVFLNCCQLVNYFEWRAFSTLINNSSKFLGVLSENIFQSVRPLYLPVISLLLKEDSGN